MTPSERVDPSELRVEMRESIFVCLGFLLAALVPPVVMASSIGPDDGFGQTPFLELVAFLYLFSIFFVSILGVPAFFLLRPFRPGHWWSVSAAGFLLGIVAAVLMRIPSRPDPHDFLSFGPIGAATALVFWLIWRLGTRPPDAKKAHLPD